MQLSGAGEHIIYDIAVPVSLAANESAVVPIASHLDIQGSRVLVYDHGEDQVSAIRSVELVNNTPLVLAPGKVSVFEGGRISAHAPFPPMLPGDDQLIAMGPDASVYVERSQERSRAVVKVSEIISDDEEGTEGVVLQTKVEIRTTYKMKNNGELLVPKLYINHTASTSHGGFAITTDADCVKTVPSKSFARYSKQLLPSEEVVMQVHEEACIETSIRGVSQVKSFLKEQAPALLASDLLSTELMSSLESLVRRQQLLGVLSTVIQRGTLDPSSWRSKMTLPSSWDELLDKCRQLNSIRARKGEVRRMIDDLGSHSSAIYTSQERLRANIKSLEKMPGSDLMARYMRDLDREEDDLIQTRAKIEEHTSTLNGLLDELEASWVELVNLASALKESTPFGGE